MGKIPRYLRLISSKIYQITQSGLISICVFFLTFVLSKLSRLFNLQFSIKTDNKPMGLFSGGLIFGSFFVHRILGLILGGFIYGWAYYRKITVLVNQDKP